MNPFRDSAINRFDLQGGMMEIVFFLQGLFNRATHGLAFCPVG